MLIDEAVPLYNAPGGVSYARVIGALRVVDVALVIAREPTKAGEVYVLGPNGGGWTPAALLKILVDPKVTNKTTAQE